MNKAAALTGVLLATALHSEEPRWTTSVPLWKVLSQQGELVAVHPGPTWYDSRGPVVPAARLGTIERVADTTPTTRPTTVLPLPREVPSLLPKELRFDELPEAPTPKPMEPTTPAKPAGPDLGPLPSQVSAESVTIDFASERTAPTGVLQAALQVRLPIIVVEMPKEEDVVVTDFATLPDRDAPTKGPMPREATSGHSPK